jgi:hypothetical protein
MSPEQPTPRKRQLLQGAGGEGSESTLMGAGDILGRGGNENEINELKWKLTLYEVPFLEE